MSYDHDLAARLERNPYNLPGDSAAPIMANFDYWRARFQRDGLRDRAGADCPHNVGTAAAQWWQEGRDHGAALSDDPDAWPGGDITGHPGFDIGATPIG